MKPAQDKVALGAYPRTTLSDCWRTGNTYPALRLFGYFAASTADTSSLYVAYVSRNEITLETTMAMIT